MSEILINVLRVSMLVVGLCAWACCIVILIEIRKSQRRLKHLLESLDKPNPPPLRIIDKAKRKKKVMLVRYLYEDRVFEVTADHYDKLPESVKRNGFISTCEMEVDE